MKEITILSGKGGTGKTSITSALASVARNAMFCDNDVDAADLHLIMQPEIEKNSVFPGAYVATIHSEICAKCGICADNCRFDAIEKDQSGVFRINDLKCEGCRLCERICPSQAISSERSANNYWYISNTRFGKLVHAKMGPGEENSGKLVSRIRTEAKVIATQKKLDYIINDGPPGIGCTAISSISGTDKVLIIIEPTRSGFHDMKRLYELVNSFNIPVAAVINKCDINPIISGIIEKFLSDHQIDLICKIPFDEKFVKSMVIGKNIIEAYPDSELSESIRTIWNTLVIEPESVK
jgi:MinD superfamily P-loop ATPase